MEWFEGQVSTAIAKCKQLKGILIVFVRDEESTSGEVEGVLNSDEVSQVVTKQPHVAIVVRKESLDYKHFTQLYPVAVVPSVFFINTETGFPLQIIRGSISVSDFVSKMQTVFEKYAKLLSKPEPSQPPTEPSSQPSTGSPTIGVPPSVTATASQGMSEAATVSKEEKIKRAEELLKQKREQRAEEEFQAEKNREMKRRSAGKELSDAARAREQKANETWMQERQQAKEEDKKARAEVLAKLERDKEERRRAREDKESELRQRHSSPTSSPPLMSSRSSGTTRLQFRVHNGPTIVQEFNSSDQLIDARTFVAEKLSTPPEHISLSSTFPSRPLPETSNEETLSELGLCPSSVIVVKTKVKSKLEKEKCDEASSRSSGTTRLQFRVHNSSTIVQEFSSSDQLIDARVFIAEKLSAPPEHISLSSTFPSRPLPETSNEETLSELGLCPSSVIVVKTKVKSKLEKEKCDEASSRSSGTARLQFRVHNSSTIVQEFSSSDQLIDARVFIAEKLWSYHSTRV
jgi:FMN-dependent NADH-azoreductase